MLVDLDLQLFVERLGVKAGGGGEGGVDQALRHAVVGDEVEADVLVGVAQFQGGLFARAWHAREIGAEVDDRDFLARVGADGIEAGGEVVHGCSSNMPASFGRSARASRVRP